MNENIDTAATEETKQGNAVVPLAPQQQLLTEQKITWGTAEFLSPLAVFQPDRVNICTRYQLAAIDSTEAESHLTAALQHARAAADQIRNGKQDAARMASLLKQVNDELIRTGRFFSVSV